MEKYVMNVKMDFIFLKMENVLKQIFVKHLIIMNVQNVLMDIIYQKINYLVQRKKIV